MPKTVEMSDDEYEKFLLFKEKERLKELEENSEELKVIEAKKTRSGIKYDIETKSYLVRLNYKGKRYPVVNYTTKYKCKTLEDTQEKILEIKKDIDRDNDPHDKTTFGTYMKKYLDNLKPDTAYICKKVYEQWAKDILDDKKPNQLSKKDIEEIYEDMEDSGRIKSNNTFQKVRSILSPTYKKLYKEGKIEKNYLYLVDMPKLKTHTELSSLNIRLKDQSFNTIVQKLYKGINNIKHDGIKNFLLVSLMTGRRPSELFRTTSDDIDKDVVFANRDMTKSKIDDRYIIPPETVKYLSGTDKEFPFKVDTHAYNRAWKKILIDEDIQFIQAFRVYDTRHLFQSIMSKYHNRDLVGSCISHFEGDTNAIYQSFEFEARKTVFREYWDVVRSKK